MECAGHAESAGGQRAGDWNGECGIEFEVVV